MAVTGYVFAMKFDTQDDEKPPVLLGFRDTLDSAIETLDATIEALDVQQPNKLNNTDGFPYVVKGIGAHGLYLGKRIQYYIEMVSVAEALNLVFEQSRNY